MSKELIVKHNEIIESKYNMTTTEIKIIAKLTSLTQKNDKDFKKHVFKAKDLLIELGLGEKNHIALEDSIEKLLTRKIEINQSNDKRLVTTFLSSCIYDNSKLESEVVLCYDPNLKPYFLQLKNNFTKYYLEDILGLRSFYSIRIYELLKQYENLRERIITIDYLKSILGLSEIRDKKGNLLQKEKYKLYGHFKNKVILVAQKELKEKTDLCFSFEQIRTGRKVTAIKFLIYSNKLEPIKPPKQETPTPVELLQQKEPSAAIEKQLDHKKFDIEEFKKLLDLIADKSLITASLKQLLKNFLEIKGFEYCKYNLIYTLEKHQTKKLSNFNGYLRKALEVDFAKDTVKKLKKENQDKKLLDKIRNMSEDERNKITMEFFEQMNEDDKKYHFEQMKQDRQFAMILDENSKSGLQYVILKYAEVNFSFIDIAKKMGV